MRNDLQQITEQYLKQIYTRVGETLQVTKTFPPVVFIFTSSGAIPVSIPEHLLESPEGKDTVHALIGELVTRHKAAGVLFVFDATVHGYSAEDLAQRDGISVEEAQKLLDSQTGPKDDRFPKTKRDAIVYRFESYFGNLLACQYYRVEKVQDESDKIILEELTESWENTPDTVSWGRFARLFPEFKNAPQA